MQPLKFVAALRNALPKVELISTSRNKNGSNKFCMERLRQGLLLWVIFRATCLAIKLRDKLQEKLPGATLPLHQIPMHSLTRHHHRTNMSSLFNESILEESYLSGLSIIHRLK